MTTIFTGTILWWDLWKESLFDWSSSKRKKKSALLQEKKEGKNFHKREMSEMKILQSLLAVFFSHLCCLSNILPRTFSNLTTCTCCLWKISRLLLSSAFRPLLQRTNVDYLQRINVFHHDFQSFCVWSLWIFCMPGWNWSVSMIVLAWVTSLPHTQLHKFTTLMISFPILIIWSPLKKK